MVNLANHSRNPTIRQDMVRRPGSGSRVGPGYVGRLIEFITATNHLWRPEVAAEHSDSLRRCLEALQTLRGWRPSQDFDLDLDLPDPFTLRDEA
jgi:hypothetical protein